MMSRRVCFVLCLIPLAASTLFADESASLPKVVLVGDSIRLSYAPIVAEQLAGKAVVIGPKANGGDSSNVLKHLDEWVIREKPDVVHFNCGIHDTKRFIATGKFQISPEQYEANLREIVKRVRDETDAIVLFATSTPILDQRAAAARQGRDYVLLDASIQQYNAIAVRVMKELAVEVNDLYAVIALPIAPNAPHDLIVLDGVHLTELGRQLVGATVAGFVRDRGMAFDSAKSP